MIGRRFAGAGRAYVPKSARARARLAFFPDAVTKRGGPTSKGENHRATG